MINISKNKNKNSLLTTLALVVSFYVLSFSAVISIINVFRLDLSYVIGYANFDVNFLLFWSIIALLTWGVGEFFIYLIATYFERAKLFFSIQRAEVKVVLKLSFILRNMIIGATYVLAYFLPILFNWLILIELLVNTLVCIVFFLIARKRFGGDFVGLHIYNVTGRLYFMFIAISIVFEVGGFLVL